MVRKALESGFVSGSAVTDARTISSQALSVQD
jgi:hypothetical protein